VIAVEVEVEVEVEIEVETSNVLMGKSCLISSSLT
jgi:hypothetical protein